MLYIFCLKKGNSEVLNVMLGFALKYSIERKNEEEGKKQIKYNGQNVSSARSWVMSILRFIVLFVLSTAVYVQNSPPLKKSNRVYFLPADILPLNWGRMSCWEVALCLWRWSGWPSCTEFLCAALDTPEKTKPATPQSESWTGKKESSAKWGQGKQALPWTQPNWFPQLPPDLGLPPRGNAGLGFQPLQASFFQEPFNSPLTWSDDFLLDDHQVHWEINS